MSHVFSLGSLPALSQHQVAAAQRVGWQREQASGSVVATVEEGEVPAPPRARTQGGWVVLVVVYVPPLTWRACGDSVAKAVSFDAASVHTSAAQAAGLSVLGEGVGLTEDGVRKGSSNHKHGQSCS